MIGDNKPELKYLETCLNDALLSKQGKNIFIKKYFNMLKTHEPQKLNHAIKEIKDINSKHYPEDKEQIEYNSRRHKIKSFTHNKRKITVDEKILPLIRELNKAGIITRFSCCGDSEDEEAYISIDTKYLHQIDYSGDLLNIRWLWKKPIKTYNENRKEIRERQNNKYCYYWKE